MKRRDFDVIVCVGIGDTAVTVGSFPVVGRGEDEGVRGPATDSWPGVVRLRFVGCHYVSPERFSADSGSPGQVMKQESVAAARLDARHGRALDAVRATRSFPAR